MFVIPNTLPSTPSVPYNLHDGEPCVSEINPISPSDDLRNLFDRFAELLTCESAHNYWAKFGDCTNENVGEPLSNQLINVKAVQKNLQFAIDIIEGNPVNDRAYSGFPLLHYNGPYKIKCIQPIKDSLDKVIGGNVDVHQIWYDTHIESDTAFLDLSSILIKDEEGNVTDVPWTITYTIDVLSRGKDDFSPMTMYFDHPKHQPKQYDCDGNLVSETDEGGRGQKQYCFADVKEPPLPNVAMDQTFFPIQEGTRTILRIKMAPPKYYNLTYTWGWRIHPPRVQVMENAGKKFPPTGDESKYLPEYEVETFGKDPMGSEHAKENAIAKISDLSPAKRMWVAFKAALDIIGDTDSNYSDTLAKIKDAWCAYHEWKDRNHLPSGIRVDEETDLTLLYVNNTIYGELSDGGLVDFPKWRTRGTIFKVTLINGDYFKHGYLNIDFGGARGWENQFKSSIKLAGSGGQFSFGRFYWGINMSKPIILEAATKVAGCTVPTKHKVCIEYNFEPSRRLRFYQFDPLHHDVAVYSLH